ncbi:MAG: DUF438 domain-containing protein, partial [Brevinematales bacterium]
MANSMLSPDQEKLREKLKEMMRQIKTETTSSEIEKLKSSFKTLLDQADPLVIAMAEQDLAREGMSMNEFLA